MFQDQQGSQSGWDRASRVGVIGNEDTEMAAVGEEEQIMTG